jgi:hypothetical protein
MRLIICFIFACRRSDAACLVTIARQRYFAVLLKSRCSLPLSRWRIECFGPYESHCLRLAMESRTGRLFLSKGEGRGEGWHQLQPRRCVAVLQEQHRRSASTQRGSYNIHGIGLFLFDGYFGRLNHRKNVVALFGMPGLRFAPRFARHFILRAALTIPSRPYPPRTRPAASRVRSCLHSHQQYADHQASRRSSVRRDT